MEIYINRIATSLLLITLATFILFGFPSTYLLFDYIHCKMTLPDYEFGKMFLSDIYLNYTFIYGIISGLWLFLNAEKYEEDKWIWLLLGLTFNYYALVLFICILICWKKSQRNELFHSMESLFILFVLAFLLHIFFVPKLGYQYTSTAMRTDFLFTGTYMKIYSFIPTGIKAIVNLLLVINVYQWIEKKDPAHRILWMIGTLIFGIIPVILLVLLQILRGDEEIEKEEERTVNFNEGNIS
jgi:hypothetical protein